MDTVVDRMERVLAQKGPDLAGMLQTQSLVSLLVTAALLVVVVEALAFTWKARFALGPKSPVVLQFWSWFLFVPVLVLAVRLTAGDEWLALMGDPHPLLAAYAMVGLDAPAGGAFAVPERAVLEEAVGVSLSGRAFQSLWPALLVCGAALSTLHAQYTRRGPPTLFAPVALVALVAFGPVAADRTLWSAWWGDGDSLLSLLERPSAAAPVEGQRPVDDPPDPQPETAPTAFP